MTKARFSLLFASFHSYLHRTLFAKFAIHNSGFPMLDLLPPEGSSHRVPPMDFSSYLLSASPPSSAFDFMGYNSPFSLAHANTNSAAPSTDRGVPRLSDFPSCPYHNLQSRTETLSHRRNGPLKSIIIKTESLSLSDTESECSESPQSPGRTPKKVSFADHKGLALAHVRLVNESPDEPPQLNYEVLSSLTKGAIADGSCKPPIKICFSQPASDYLAFRDKISSNLVSLENVILRDYSVEGTIKVKNVSFEKHVFVRISLDEWESSEDVTATYVPGPGMSYAEAYDTFTFTIDISPKFDVTKKVQFAVCFEENGRSHWDNNNSDNYCIVSENYEALQPKKEHVSCFNPRWLPQLDKQSQSWTEFSSWRDAPTDIPFY